MCGIAGIVSARTGTDVPGALRAMAKAIAHRGPDDEGYFDTRTRGESHRVGLAHRRLSIIDLATGHQPLGNEDGAIQIVFNGEIYNFQPLRDELIAHGHRFATHSDTETIVHAYEQWGDDCVTRLRGMFAFALWDGRRDRLLLARDRFGEKPLFLLQSEGEWLFASEIKALLAVRQGLASEVDRAALWDYLAYRYVPGPATLYKAIRKLMPGCVAVWEGGQLTERRYYRPPDAAPHPRGPVRGDPVQGLLQHLDRAVAGQMMADVPFGAFLSGGLDSSGTVALMSRHSAHPVKTYSVGFAEESYSELGYARVVAEHFGTDHHELVFSQGDVVNHLPALIRFRDAPVAEPSDIPIYLLARYARQTVKMVLTGEGADEVLGGYPKHVFERYAGPYGRLPGLLRHGLIEPLVRALPHRFRRASTAIASLGERQFEPRMARWFGAMDERERRLLTSLPPAPLRPDAYPFQSSADNSALRRILYFDQTSWLPDNLLERGDRMTMAASLESRMPFLDHELVAFVSGLPDSYRVRGRNTKWIFREAMKHVLPAAILTRPKVGFRVPVDVWFRGPLKAFLYDHLTGPDARTAAYLNRPAVLKLLDEHCTMRHNREKVLWSLLSLELWHRGSVPAP